MLRSMGRWVGEKDVDSPGNVDTGLCTTFSDHLESLGIVVPLVVLSPHSQPSSFFLLG